MKTLVYHITYYDYDKSLYIQFARCNFGCLGCIRKRYLWDHHIYKDSDAGGFEVQRFNTLSLEEFVEIIEKVYVEKGLKKAVLGGGEPTVDPTLCRIIDSLYSYGLEIVVLTNGFLMDRVIGCIPRNNLVIELSIKSLHPEKFSIYTGRRCEDLQVVLRNLELVYSNNIDLVIETILIPGFNDIDDVELIAKYIASRLSNDIPLIIDEYVPIPSTPWRKPTLEELVEAKIRAEKYLRKVVIRSSYTMKPLGNVYQIYPKTIE